MKFDHLPLADLAASASELDVIDDQRRQYGYVLVACPHDDGTADHVLHIHNPTGNLPAHAYCLSEACRRVPASDFIMLLDLKTGVL